MLASRLPLYLPPSATFCLFYWPGLPSPVCQSWRALRSQTTPCCTVTLYCFNNTVTGLHNSLMNTTRQAAWLATGSSEMSPIRPPSLPSSSSISFDDKLFPYFAFVLLPGVVVLTGVIGLNVETSKLHSKGGHMQKVWQKPEKLAQ